eukprot:Skav219926  [mRNA]  locus=scaffold2006:268764:269952:- [translate_table: standard]
MEALAPKGYRSVALRLHKSRCTSLGDYVSQLQEPTILIGHSLGGAIVEVLLTRRTDAAKKACGAVLLCAVPVMSFCSLVLSCGDMSQVGPSVCQKSLGIPLGRVCKH